MCYRLSTMPLDINSLAIFDEVLEYYNWPEHSDDTLLEKMSDVNNFDASNYKLAVSCYINWCTNLYHNMEMEEKDDYKLALAQQLLNILHTHAAHHHIHKALAECQIKVTNILS